ncbi:hypothetical protein N9K15_02125 [Maribacter arcticus]|nr:hypothetical protein [Maribacter arcticus]MDA9089720.1 hypothetical protein [Maribacter arcticus]
MSYNLETYQEPFWAKSGNFIRGRDPLGIQNSSISVYATLLPGMTNLTLRLRYYGTYLWLLDQYDQLPANNIFKEDQQGQYTFIRRAELIIAYVMVNKYPDEQSVIGSNFVSKNFNEIQEKGYYDIALGADKHRDTPIGSVYWDYTSGALGQYYAGSLVALNLIHQSSGYFHRTEEYGKELAEAYANSLSSEVATLFLQRISEGKLYSEDIDGLNDIALNKDYKSTPEGEFYIKMLLSNDGPKSKTASDMLPSQRKESLQLFMTLLNTNQDEKAWLDLPITSYNTLQTKSKKEVSEATFGWYYYYLNELAHYSLETVFWGLLVEMDKGTYSLQQFINHITNSVLEYYSKTLEDFKELTIGDLINKLDDKEFITLDYIHNMGISVNENNSITGITEALFALLCLYRDNQHKLEEANYYAVNHFLSTKNGNALEIFQIYITSSYNLNFEEFVRKLVHNLLNEHIAIAYNKMGNGEKNLLKFVIEDNYLVHIETMTPNFTNPRLRTLYNFTKDLDLINSKDELTVEGKNLLKQLIG